jgi:hypothetical protein
MELAEANGASTDAAKLYLQNARSALALAGERAAQAAKRNVEREDQRGKLAAELQRLNTQADSAATSIAEHEKKRQNEIDLIVRKKTSAIEQIRGERDKLQQQEAHIADLRRKVSALEARIDMLRGERVPLDTPDAGELERIEIAIKTAREQAGLQREIKCIIAEIDRLDATVDVMKAIEWALQRIREEELQARGAGILGHMNRFLSAAGRPEVPFLEAGRGKCEIGWVRPDGKRVTVQTLSGGEYALFCAALVASILAERGGQIRILIVEAAEADNDMLDSLMRGISSSREITHAILLTAHDVRAVAGDPIHSDWNVVASYEVPA